MSTEREGSRGKLDGPGRHLEDWVEASIISADQAERIRAFERSAHEPAAEGRIALVTEALGYLGVALALAAGSFVVGRLWDDMSTTTHLVGLAATAAALLAAGAFANRSSEPAIKRLGGVLWFISTGVAMWFLAVMSMDAIDMDDPNVLLTVGVGGALYGGALYTFRPSALQQLAMFVGLAMVAVYAGGRLSEGRGEWMREPRWVSPVLWSLGVAWLLLAWRRLITPARAGYVIGSVTALWAGTFAMDGWVRPVMLLGLLTAVGLIAASVALRQTVLLGIGVVGLFIYTIRTITVFYGDRLGTPVALLIAGVLILVAALLTTRLRWFTTSGSKGAPA